MEMGHAEYGAAGVEVGTESSSILKNQLLGAYNGGLQNSSAPYGGGRSYDYLSLDRCTGGATYGRFGGYDSIDHFGGAVRGLGMGISNGGAMLGGVLGVGGFEFDESPLCHPITSWRLTQ